MAGLINKRIPASTLLEVLIAMVVIMTVFTIALKVFHNVLSSSVSFKKIRINNQLNLLKEEARQYGIKDQIIEVDSIIYTFKVNPSDIENLNQLEIRATEQGKLVASVKCFVRKGGDDEN